MRWLVAVMVSACSGSAGRSNEIAGAGGPHHVVHEGPPVDVLATLAGTTDQASWILQGPIQLEVGGAPIDAVAKTEPIEVRLIEHQGSAVRVGVRLEGVHFAVWTDRARLLAIAAREVAVRSSPGAGDLAVVSQGSLVGATLKPGARVRRMGHKDQWTQIRYAGAVEISGWLPDGALVDEAPAGDPVGRIPSGRQVLLVTPGAVIRAEPRATATELAVMANGYFVETIRTIDDAWVEISYEDGDATLHGYVSKRDPPGRIHRLRGSEPASIPSPTPNALVASGTCLYPRESGDPIGYVVGDQHLYMESSPREGWYTVSIETPWGAIAFAAQRRAPTTRALEGAVPREADLVACAPPESVPSSARAGSASATSAPAGSASAIAPSGSAPLPPP